jgi:hypothetical protein
MINDVLCCCVMFRGRYSYARSVPPTPSSTPFSRYNFLYRFRPSFNFRVFSHFPTRTDPSSLYRPSFQLLGAPYRKTGGGGRGEPSFSPLATRHSLLPLSPTIPTLLPSLPRVARGAFFAKGTQPRLSLIIPALTRTPRGEGVQGRPSSNTLHLSTHSVNVGAPTFLECGGSSPLLRLQQHRQIDRFGAALYTAKAGA